MVCAQRQQASFDEEDEEAEEAEEVEFYHQTCLQDTMILMENDMEAEGIDLMMECASENNINFESQLQDLRKTCVSGKSQNNYPISVTNMINRFSTNINEVQYGGFCPLM